MILKINLADTIMEIQSQSLYTQSLLRPYQVDFSLPSEYSFLVTEEDIEKEAALAQSAMHKYSFDYLESLALYRKICEKLLEKNILLFHASALLVEGKAYLFTAPSGTGKSTHAKMWRQFLPDKVTMINDDKPLIRFSEGKAFVYGTPWCGKHKLQNNICAEIEAIVILQRDFTDWIKIIDIKKSINLLWNQVYHPVLDSSKMKKTLELFDQLLTLPLYQMGCTISVHAAEVAYKALMKKDKEYGDY